MSRIDYNISLEKRILFITFWCALNCPISITMRHPVLSLRKTIIIDSLFYFPLRTCLSFDRQICFLSCFSNTLVSHPLSQMRFFRSLCTFTIKSNDLISFYPWNYPLEIRSIISCFPPPRAIFFSTLELLLSCPFFRIWMSVIFHVKPVFYH